MLKLLKTVETTQRFSIVLKTDERRKNLSHKREMRMRTSQNIHPSKCDCLTVLVAAAVASPKLKQKGLQHVSTVKEEKQSLF